MSPFMRGNVDARNKAPLTSDNSQDRSRDSSAHSNTSNLGLVPSTNAVQAEPFIVAGKSASNRNSNESNGESAVLNGLASANTSAGGGILSRSRSDYALNVMTTSNTTARDVAGVGICGPDSTDNNAPSDRRKDPTRETSCCEGPGSNSSPSSGRTPDDSGKNVRHRGYDNTALSDSNSSSGQASRETGKVPMPERITTNPATGRIDITIDYDDPDVILPDPLPARKKGGLPTAGGVPLGQGTRTERLVNDGTNTSNSAHQPDGSNDTKAAIRERSTIPNPLQTFQSLTGINPYKQSKTKNKSDEVSVDSDIKRAVDTPNQKFRKTAVADHRAEVAILERRGWKRDFHPGEARSHTVAKSRMMAESEVVLLRWIQRHFKKSRASQAAAESRLTQERAARALNRRIATPYSRSGAVGARNSVPSDAARRQAATERQSGPSSLAVHDLGVLPEASPDRRHTEPAAGRRPSAIAEKSGGRTESDPGLTHRAPDPATARSSRPPRSAIEPMESIGHRRTVDFAPVPYRHNHEAFRADLPELTSHERARNSMTNFCLEVTHRKTLVAHTVTQVASQFLLAAAESDFQMSDLRRFSAPGSLFGGPNDPPRATISRLKSAWRTATGATSPIRLGGRVMTSSERVEMWDVSEGVAPGDTSLPNPTQSVANGAEALASTGTENPAVTTFAAEQTTNMATSDAAIPNATAQDVNFAMSPAATTQPASGPPSLQISTHGMGQSASLEDSRRMSEPISPGAIRQMSDPISPGGSRQSSIPSGPEVLTARGTDFVPPSHPATNFENVRPRTHMGAGSSGTPLSSANQPQNMRNPRGWINTQLAVEMNEAELPVGEGSSKAVSVAEEVETVPVEVSSTTAAPGEEGISPGCLQSADGPTTITDAAVGSNLDSNARDTTRNPDSTPAVPRVGALTGPSQAADHSITTTDLTGNVNLDNDNAQDATGTADDVTSVHGGTMHDIDPADTADHGVNNAVTAAMTTNDHADPDQSRRRSSWLMRGRDSIIALPKKTVEAVKNLANRPRGGGQQIG